ncbi:hypothetical protein D3C80_1096140 [compost metagenome]
MLFVVIIRFHIFEQFVIELQVRFMIEQVFVFVAVKNLDSHRDQILSLPNVSYVSLAYECILAAEPLMNLKWILHCVYFFTPALQRASAAKENLRYIVEALNFRLCG